LSEEYAYEKWKNIWKKQIEEAERQLTEAFEVWLKGKSRAELEDIIRSIWKCYSLRMVVLPYQEILEARRKMYGKRGEKGDYTSIIV